MSGDKLIIERLKGEDGFKVFSVRVEERTINDLNEIAAQTNRTRNELVRLFLRYAIDHCEINESN